METEKLSGWLRLLRWAKDVILIPSRLRLLTEATSADLDARLRCPSCPAGRLGALATVPNAKGSEAVATCDACGMAYEVRLRDRIVVRLLEH